jgi:hypothetical protein
MVPRLQRRVPNRERHGATMAILLNIESEQQEITVSSLPEFGNS